MRAVLIGTLLIGLWLGFGAPVPVLRLDPLPSNPGLPTFEEAVADSDMEQAAVESGQIPQNPERRKLREAVLHAASQLKISPCNRGLQQRLLAAAVEFIESRKIGPPEMGVVNGKERDVSRRFDARASQAIRNAIYDGAIDPEDLGDGHGYVVMQELHDRGKAHLCDDY